MVAKEFHEGFHEGYELLVSLELDFNKLFIFGFLVFITAKWWGWWCGRRRRRVVIIEWGNQEEVSW
jgi:hypothetical protein